MKTRSMGAELFHPDETKDGRTDGRTDGQTDAQTDGRTEGRSDGRTDGDDEANSRFRNFANVPKKNCKTRTNGVPRRP
jgi:hypothetical protein